MLRILISGAGIAGPTLAYWLHRYGLEPTMVERWPQPRRGGYIIDFWGVGFDVAERMGLSVESCRLCRAPSICKRRQIGRMWATQPSAAHNRTRSDRGDSVHARRGGESAHITEAVEASILINPEDVDRSSS